MLLEDADSREFFSTGSIHVIGNGTGIGFVKVDPMRLRFGGIRFHGGIHKGLR